MKFKAWYEESTKTNNRVFTAQEFYEAGASSRQAEINALQKKYDKVLKAFYLVEKHRYELGKRVDELHKKLAYSEDAHKDVKLKFLNEEDDLSALKNRIYNTLSAACDNECNHAVIDILKGDKND